MSLRFSYNQKPKRNTSRTLRDTSDRHQSHVAPWLDSPTNPSIRPGLDLSAGLPLIQGNEQGVHIAHVCIDGMVSTTVAINSYLSPLAYKSRRFK